MHGAGSVLLRFCILGEGLNNIRCRLAGNILHSHALTHICDEAGATGFLRQLEISHELVEDHDPLGAAFSGSHGFEDSNAVDELPEKLVRQRSHFQELSDMPTSACIISCRTTALMSLLQGRSQPISCEK